MFCQVQVHALRPWSLLGMSMSLLRLCARGSSRTANQAALLLAVALSLEMHVAILQPAALKLQLAN